MPRSKTPTVSLDEVKARFEEWRRDRRGKTSIPDDLWTAAAELARREGVNRTSTELRIEWNELKRRIAAPISSRKQVSPPAFIELVATPRTQSHPECTIELEGGRGKLRIQVKNASASYLATLSRELWESAS